MAGERALVSSAGGQGLPGTTRANLDIGTVSYDPGNILTESSAGVYRPDEPGQYLIVASGEFESTHDNRQNIKWIGSRNGTDVDGFVGDSYSRHNEADFLIVHAYAILPFNGTTDTFEIDDIRDTGGGTPAGDYNWTYLKVIRLSDTTTALPYGHYGTPISTAHSGSSFTNVSGWDVISETDTTVVELQADTINVELKEADRPYLIVYGLANSDAGSVRTGRMSRLQHNATTIAHSYGGAYQRNNTTQYAGPVGIGLVRPATANQDLKVQLAGYEWVNTTAWGIFDIGSWMLSATEAGFMVIALPSGANVAIFEDTTAAQSIHGTGVVDINHSRSAVGTVDSPFSRINNTDVDVTSAVDVLAVGTLASERIISSGERGSHGIRWEVEAVDDTATEGYMFVRGDQSDDDHYNGAMRAVYVGSSSANDTFQLERFMKGLSEQGTNDDTMYAGSFFIDLDSLTAAGTNYDETGRTVSVAATISETDTTDYTENPSVAVVAMISSTDVHTTGGTAYDETGLTVTVVATVTGSDIVAFDDVTTVTIVATITSTDGTGGVVVEAVSTFASATNSYTATVDKPSGTVEGDLLIAWFGFRDGGEDTAIATRPSGFTVIEELGSVSSTYSWSGLYWKIAGASEPSTYSCVVTAAASGRPVAWCARISGHDSTNPVHLADMVSDSTWDTSSVAPSLSPTISDGFLLSMMQAYSLTATVTKPASMDEVLYINNTNMLNAMLASEQLSASGATGTRTFTTSGSERNNTASIVVEAGSGPTYDETGLTVSVVATIAKTDTVAFANDVSVTATATIAETDTAAFTDDVAVAITVSITSTDSTAYAETGRAILIVSTISSTDEQHYSFDETGLTVSIAASTSATDTVAFTDDRTVTIVASVSVQDAAAWTETVTVASAVTITETDSLGQYETALPVGIVATISATDDHTVADQNYDETGRSFAIVATVTATDVASFADDTTVSIVCTVSSTDNLNGVNFDETGRSISVVATITSIDTASLTESVAVTVNSLTTVTATAAFTNDITVSVVATITATDVYTSASQGYDETGRTVPVVSTITSTDTAAFDETTSVTIVASVSETDTAAYTNDTSIAVVATTTSTDSLSFGETGRVFAIVSTCTVTDGLGLYESVTVAVTAAWSTTDTFAGIDNTSVAAVATTTTIDNGGFTDSLAIPIVATITVVDNSWLTMPLTTGLGSAGTEQTLGHGGSTTTPGVTVDEDPPGHSGSTTTPGVTTDGTTPGTSHDLQSLGRTT